MKTKKKSDNRDSVSMQLTVSARAMDAVAEMAQVAGTTKSVLVECMIRNAYCDYMADRKTSTGWSMPALGQWPQ